MCSRKNPKGKFFSIEFLSSTNFFLSLQFCSTTFIPLRCHTKNIISCEIIDNFDIDSKKVLNYHFWFLRVRKFIYLVFDWKFYSMSYSRISFTPAVTVQLSFMS